MNNEALLLIAKTCEGLLYLSTVPFNSDPRGWEQVERETQQKIAQMLEMAVSK